MYNEEKRAEFRSKVTGVIDHTYSMPLADREEAQAIESKGIHMRRPHTKYVEETPKHEDFPTLDC